MPSASPGVVVEVMLDPGTMRLRSEVRDATSNQVLLRLGAPLASARPPGLNILV